MTKVHRLFIFPLICFISERVPRLVLAIKAIHEEIIKPFMEDIIPHNWRFVNMEVALVMARMFLQFRLSIARRMTRKLSYFMGSLWGVVVFIRGSRVYA
jgi:hypothetical protein